MVQKPLRIMISSLYEKRIGAISLSLVTVHKYDVRNSESSTGSIEGKKEAKRHPVSHAAPCSVSRRRDVRARARASNRVTIFKIILEKKKRSVHPRLPLFYPKEESFIRKDFPTD